MLEEKDYTKWHKVKTIEHNNSLGKSRGLNYKEGQIYWVSVGQNIGYEEDGKGNLFVRPVLVVRGYNRHIFLGVPLTTKIKHGPFYYSFKAKCSSAISVAILSQIRTFDTARISSHRPLGTIDNFTLQEVKRLLAKMIV